MPSAPVDGLVAAAPLRIDGLSPASVLSGFVPRVVDGVPAELASSFDEEFATCTRHWERCSLLRGQRVLVSNPSVRPRDSIENNPVGDLDGEDVIFMVGI